MDTQEQERKRILIAEDQQDLREALFTALAADGHEVFVAEDGEAAVKTAFAEHPDLVILDIKMPKKNGQEVLEELRADEWGANVKIIILSALGDMHTVSTTLKLGSHDYLIKNDWELQDIVKKVNEKLAA